MPWLCGFGVYPLLQNSGKRKHLHEELMGRETIYHICAKIKKMMKNCTHIDVAALDIRS